MKTFAIVFLALASLALAADGPQPKPADAPQDPRGVKGRSTGPKRNPAKFIASKFDSMPPHASFRSFVSSCYALDNVWLYAAGDDAEAICEERLVYLYPKFYTPTWGEVFDHVARQMRCKWSWNRENRQFKFQRSKARPTFGVKLAENWRREDRGLYVWHAPKDADFGLDIYDFGHYTAPPDAGDDFVKKVREHVATHMLQEWPKPPTAAEMKLVKVAGEDALHLSTDTPRPGGIWRQWSLLVDGHAFLIVSAMPKAKEAELMPAVEQMVATFKTDLPTTRPTTRKRNE